MASILIWMSPEGSHVLPTVKFARDLQKRGHRLVYLTCGQLLKELQALNFDTLSFLPVGEEALARRSMLYPRGPSLLYRDVRSHFRDYSEYIQAIRCAIRDAATAVEADLVLVDGILDTALGLMVRNHLPDRFRVARIHVALPYEPLSAEERLGRFGPSVFLSPREFELPDFATEEASYTEACYYHELPQDRSWSAGIQDGRPIVFCSLGAQVSRFPQAPEVFQRVMAAANSLQDYHFVISSGYLRIPPPCAENVSVLPFVRNADILPHAAAAITHGGFGTIKECIYFEVPALICPQQWDQPMNARRVEHHGLGLHMSVDQMVPDSIARALERVMTSAQMKANLRRMRQQFLETEAKELTANKCEALLSA